MHFLIDTFHGFCMALADSVPGVSGGSIAFILGFYDQFIHSLNALIFGKKNEKKAALFFLMKLGLGWVIGFVAAVLVISSLFEKKIYEVSSLFIGFILFAIPFLMKDEKKVLKGKYQNICYFLLGIFLVAMITYFNPINASSMDISHLNLGLAAYVFFAAIVAISAMVLPGISGSTLLLIFGLYLPIIDGIKEILHLNFTYFPVLCIFGLGVLVGILLTIRIIEWALKKYRSQMIYLILGLMIGSIYAIVMGPTTLEPMKDPLSIQTFSWVFFFLGGLIIFLLEYSKVWLEKRNEKKNFNHE